MPEWGQRVFFMKGQQMIEAIFLSGDENQSTIIKKGYNRPIMINTSELMYDKGE